MLKSCKYCGRIHDSKFNCGKKPIKVKARTDIDRFRSTVAWQNKREEIRQRDRCLCQICYRNLYNTIDRYTYNNLSVHHAIPIEEDVSKSLDNDYLLTVCDMHHEMAESKEIPIDIILQIIAEQEKK